MFLYGGQGREAVYMPSHAIAGSCRPCSFTAEGKKTQSGSILAPFLYAPCVKRGREGEEAAHNVNQIMVNHSDAS